MTTAQSDRTWSLPKRRWMLAMSWHDLLFLHWPVPVSRLRPLIPAELQIDTFDGQAWLGFVPFTMTGVRPRYVPSLPGMSRFAEFNVRTYVIAQGKPGVWFFSLDAANPRMVWLARRTFHLPYYNARISIRKDAQGWIHYQTTRIHRGTEPVSFQGSYRPTGTAYRAKPGTLDYWLTARYCLYAEKTKGRVFRGEIDHAPWKLQRAEAELGENTMAEPLGIELPDTAPLLHFSERIDVQAWMLRPVKRSG